MPQIIDSEDKDFCPPVFGQLCEPVREILGDVPLLKSRSNKPLALTVEDYLKALIFCHIEEHTSGCHLLQVLEADDFARDMIAPVGGIRKSTFFETPDTRGLRQLLIVYASLVPYASGFLPFSYGDYGELVAVGGSFTDVVLSMCWADYRKKSKKARIHLGSDISRSVPSAFFLTDGKSGERPFLSLILSPGQTGITDRGYQCHRMSDLLRNEGKNFVCRIRSDTKKTIISENPLIPGSVVFYDAKVLLGTPGVCQTEKEVRLVGYGIDNAIYWVATNRHDLSAEDIAAIYKLRWDIGKFFAWWKRHPGVCHIIARSRYGLTVQIIAGLITYLLLAICFRIRHNEKVSISRIRQMRAEIRNENRLSEHKPSVTGNINIVINLNLYCKIKC